MRWLAAFLFWICSFSTAQAAIKGEPVEYKQGETVLEGYMAYDDAIQGKRPGILVVHEWKGHNDYVRKRAEQLAGLGYIAFAVDMYGKGVHAKDHEEAAKLSGALKQDRRLMRDRARAGLEVLKQHPLTDVTRLGAIGYCFGGMTVLELARDGADLLGVVTFHGALNTPHPEDAKHVKGAVLVLHGEDDPFIKPEEVRDFEIEMQDAGVSYWLVKLPGAVHSFTVPEAGNDPSKGMAYNAEADQKSWQLMQEFFAKLFKPAAA